MLAKIIWRGSGDEISFISTSPDLLCYYVEQLNLFDANRFSVASSKFDYSVHRNLEQNLLAILNLANKLPFQIDEWDGDLLDQNYLNKLHRQWVKTGIEYPKLPLLLRQMGNLDKEFRDINSNLHKIENSFRYKFVNYNADPFQIKNIFSKDILSFDITNLMLGFDNLGRSNWEKYSNWDDNVDDSDTNNFQMLSGLVHLNLRKPSTMPPPCEYVEWCKKHNIPVVGKNLNIGNIVDLGDKLKDIRKILIRNTYEQNDQFFFEVCS